MSETIAAQDDSIVGSLKSLSAEDVVKLVTLSSVSRALNVTSDTTEALTSVLETVMSALNADRGFIQLSDQGRVLQEVSRDRSVTPHGDSFAYSTNLIQEGLAGPVLMLDAKVESAFHSAISTGIRSVMVQPIISSSGVLGVIYLDSLLKVGRFLDNELTLLGIIADMVSVFLERTRNGQALLVKSRELEWTLADLVDANELFRTSAEETIFKLSRAAEFRDDETGEHVQRVSHYCELVALQVGFTPAAAADLRLASQLHDVGKVGLPDSILLKTGRYTEYEREIMKQHTTIGAKILGGSSSPTIRLAEEMALTHHEKWDGTGYPNGLSGEQIPLSGRIVALADVFDALVTERRYKKGWSPERAFKLITDEAGAHFDPTLAKVFVDLSEQILEIRDRFQPPPMADVAEPTETGPALRTRAEGLGALEPLRQGVDALSRGNDFFNAAIRAAAILASLQLVELMGSLGMNVDSIRRLNSHFKREDLLQEQAPRLAELLGDVERLFAQEESGTAAVTALLVDPDPRQRDSLSVEASHRGIGTVEAHDIASAQAAIQIRPPSLVIVEPVQPGGRAFLDWLATEHSGIGIVVLSSEGGFVPRLEAARRGAWLYLDKPISATAVMEEIQERLVREAPRVYRVLALGEAPSGDGYALRNVHNPIDILTALDQEMPDMLLVDLDLHPVAGLDICRVLRANPRYSGLRILAINSHPSEAAYREALKAGTNDVLASVSATRILGHLKAPGREHCVRDSVTGLTDLPVALRVAKPLFALAVKTGVPFTLCSLRIDRYAELVQSRGRGVATQLLCQIGDILERSGRSEDVLTRYRDDCFLLALHGLTVDGAAKIADGLNARLTEIFPSGAVRCTPAFSSYPLNGTNLRQLLEKIDASLAQ